MGLTLLGGGPLRVVALLCLVASLVTSARSRAAGGDGDGRMLEEPPGYGLYYDRYEPAFYTGFAPRTLDPQRMQIHLGRGDQMRVTVVLADDVLREYARDLRERDRTYRALIDSGRLVLTQNRGFEQFSGRSPTRVSSTWQPRSRRCRTTRSGSAICAYSNDSTPDASSASACRSTSCCDAGWSGCGPLTTRTWTRRASSSC